jgi:RNA processing factor Prp31
MSVRSDEAGKAARMLAAKISIASRVDYGKGKFVGDKLLKEVEGKFKIKV